MYSFACCYDAGSTRACAGAFTHVASGGNRTFSARANSPLPGCGSGHAVRFALRNPG